MFSQVTADPRQAALMQAHAIHNVFQLHSDGAIDLNNAMVQKQQFDQMAARFDSDSAALLRNALIYYVPKVITADYAETLYADPTGFVPRLSDGTMVGVSEIVKTFVHQVGKWESTGEKTRTGGRIDVGVANIVYGTHYKTASIEYSSQELDRISFAQQNGNSAMMVDLVQLKMGAVRDAYNRFINEAMAFGMPDRDVFGLHTHPNILRIQAPYRPGSLRTRVQNIALFTLAINEMQRVSGNLFRPDIVIGPSNILTELQTQDTGTAGESSTLKFINDNTSIKAYIPTPEASGGARNGKEILHFMRRDTDTTGVVPKVMTQLAQPVFDRGCWSIHWDASVGGVHVDRQYKHLIMELPDA